jgi:hypothetical protein
VATGRIGVTPTLRTRWSDQPTAGTTVLSGLDDNSVSLVYDVGYEAVYRNGALLSRGNDYTATNGTTVTLIDATLAGDIIEIFANQLVPLTDAISKGQFTAKGALLSATAASTPGVLAVGTDGQILTAASGQSTGLQWATPASASPTSAQSFVTTKQTTSSTSYTGLSTAQAVTLTTGTKVMVCLTVKMEPNSPNSNLMSYAISGSTTKASADSKSACFTRWADPVASPELNTWSAVYFETVTAGSNTFTLQFRVSGGTGYFLDRQLLVIDLGS